MQCRQNSALGDLNCRSGFRFLGSIGGAPISSAFERRHIPDRLQGIFELKGFRRSRYAFAAYRIRRSPISYQPFHQRPLRANYWYRPVDLTPTQPLLAF